MKKIQAVKNSFFVGDCEIVLRGVAIQDPCLLSKRTNIKKVITLIKNLGYNVIRIPIQPGNYQTISRYLDLFIEPIVQTCQKENIYVIIDWHAIGNPVTGQTRRSEEFIIKNNKKIYYHDAHFKVAMNAWSKIAKRFGAHSNVIFELFNEPAPGNKQLEDIQPLFWYEWKPLIEKLIKKVRLYSHNVILVSGNKWAMGLQDVFDNPVVGENIGYSAHPYPIHKEWKKILPKFKKRFPLILTEWAFVERSDISFWVSTEKKYGNPLIKMCNELKISWVAWCFSDVWDPKMIKSWNPIRFTPWGKFVKSKLKKN